MGVENDLSSSRTGPASPSATPPRHYVGIGASAGGLESIEAFVTNMPPENGLALIIFQHLCPDCKSLMVELLAKRTRLAVHRVEDGMRVDVDAIYLIPPKKNRTIFYGKLFLGDPERSRSGIFLPMDTFFRSLARDQMDLEANKLPTDACGEEVPQCVLKMILPSD